jgi:hypothetical protein
MVDAGYEDVNRGELLWWFTREVERDGVTHSI